MDFSWHWAHFSELTAPELYQILQLRAQVFILEQQCLYQDIDGLDGDSWHLSATNDTGELVAYLRVIAPGKQYNEPAIGRVVTDKNYRGIGLGRLLLQKGIKQTKDHFPQANIRISAQSHLSSFYRSCGFVCVGEPYLEDGIQHIEMLSGDNTRKTVE